MIPFFSERLKHKRARLSVLVGATVLCCLALPAFGKKYAHDRHQEEVSAQISVYQLVFQNNPSVRHWFLASGPNDGADADSDVLAFFAKNPCVQPYSLAGWCRMDASKSMQVGDRNHLSKLVDKASGEPGNGVAIESVIWKTRSKIEAKVAFWDNTGLAHGPIYTLVKTKRGWVVDTLQTGYWGEVN